MVHLLCSSSKISFSLPSPKIHATAPAVIAFHGQNSRLVAQINPRPGNASRRINGAVKASTTNDAISGTTIRVPEADHRQIGITSFFQAKNYFVTGATGFLAKVLIEKILRTLPDAGKIYLLIKAVNQEAVIERLKSEVIDSEVFKCLKAKHGKFYEEFMMSKLIPVMGDISKPNLGMNATTAADIAKQTHLIVNSAANTTLDERYDVALDVNTRGPARLMTFAKTCKNLCLFLQVSTAYVNGEREGVVSEKPFVMGQSIAGERVISGDQPLSIPVLDLDAESELISEVLKSVDEKTATPRMKELGLERARMYGWLNVYQLSKAMGEMVINSTRGEIPVVIMRPTIVESTYREPFPGWIQGYKVLDPLILSYGKGNLPGFLADPKTVIDVVPADIVVNAIIAAMAKHGIAAKPELNVYHVSSSVANPLDMGALFEFCCEHFAASPLINSKGNQIGVSQMEFLDSMDNFSTYISNETVKLSGNRTTLDPNVQRRVEKLCKKKAEYFIHIAKMYEPYMFYNGWFDNWNTQKLIEEMSIEEAWNFDLDIRSVNWKHYLKNIHIPGLKKHILMMKENNKIAST